LFQITDKSQYRSKQNKKAIEKQYDMCFFCSNYAGLASQYNTLACSTGLLAIGLTGWRVIANCARKLIRGLYSALSGDTVTGQKTWANYNLMAFPPDSCRSGPRKRYGR
jgi:hypothetical protein